MKLGCIFWLGLSGVSAIAVPSQAQITIDGTTNTILDSNGNSIIINGGDRAGDNLFHSFEDFSVINGNEAFFNNAADISNIFSRVTGGNISNIDGLLRANGGANLFIINPAGIIFGEGASLDIGGSFFASSADSIVFSDDIEFSAIDRDNPPLLTINQPIGLVLGDNAGAIVNQSVANDVGLQVSEGNNLTLVGGDIEFNGGTIIAPGANINLGGLSAAGEISINADGSLSFPEGVRRSDVTLTNGTYIDVQAGGGGNITVNANNIELSSGELGASFLLAGIAIESGSPKAQAGDIVLDATGDIDIIDSVLVNNVEPFGIGNSGNININATNLNVTQGSNLISTTLGMGNSGNITIFASDTVTVDNKDSPRFQTFLGTNVREFGEGNAGNIDISTTNLFIRNGADISASTLGKGNGGKIAINASNNIVIEGENSSGFPSGIFAQTFNSQTVDDSAIKQRGNAGEIEIVTKNLFLTDGATITTTTSGEGNGGKVFVKASDTIFISGQSSVGIRSAIASQVSTETAVGNAGEIEIDTANLVLKEGGFISADTFGIGNAGQVIINASDTITIDGNNSSSFATGIFSRVAEEAVGEAAGIKIFTDSLSLTNEAEIAVSSIGQASAGDLFIGANSLSLDNSFLLAFTPVGKGGSITLDIADTVILRNDSSIVARAFESAKGGNVKIDAGSVVAFPNQNNDIIAAAEQGKGGEINITTSAIFGLAEGNSTITNLTNDLDASSEFGIDGTIAINELDVNPAEGLEELPTDVIDVASLVAQNLCQQGNRSEFIVTGKGGLASSPSQMRSSNLTSVDLVEPVLTSQPLPQPLSYEERGEMQGEGGNARRGEKDYEGEAEEKIVEAQGWIVNSSGVLELVAQKTNVDNFYSPQPKHDIVCQK